MCLYDFLANIAVARDDSWLYGHSCRLGVPNVVLGLYLVSCIYVQIPLKLCPLVSILLFMTPINSHYLLLQPVKN